MNTENLIKSTLAAVIVLIVVVTVAIPIFGGVSEVRTAADNTGMSLYMEELDTSTPGFTIAAANSKVTVGTLDVTELFPKMLILAYCDSFVVWATGTSTMYVVLNGSQEATTSIAVTSTKITYTPTGGSSKDVNITGDLLYASSLTSGTYGLWTPMDGDTAINYVDEDHVFKGLASTTAKNDLLDPGTVYIVYSFSGTADDFDIDLANASGTGTLTLTDDVVENADLGTYTLTLGTPSGSWTNTTGTYTNTNHVILMISETAYTYTSEQDKAMTSMINIIPLLLIVAVIMAVIGAFLYMRAA